MKKLIKFLLVVNVLLLLVFAFPSSVSAEALNEGQTIFGDDFTLESNHILDGDLTVFGGLVDLKPESTVKGDVFVLGGVVTVSGTIEGDLTAIGSTVTLDESALIEGDLNVPGSQLTRSSGAEIQGDQITNWVNPFENLDIPSINTPRILQRNIFAFPFVNWIGRFIGMTLLMSALGALFLLAMPKKADRMAQALDTKPWTIFGYGVLTGLAYLGITFILIITICLIPIAILLALVFSLAILLGKLALGYKLGKLIVEGIFKSKWSAVPTAVIGNLSLHILVRAVRLIPCLGGFVALLISLFGLGLVVVTLFGSKSYPRSTEVKEEDYVVINDGSVDSEDGQEDQENLTDEQKES